MATKHHNLSKYDKNQIPDGEHLRIGLVIAEWNIQITQALADGAINTLNNFNVAPSNIDVKYVPGAFELPLGAQLMLSQKNYDAVICIGSVIRGETEHFTFVCEAASQGIKDVSLATNKPIVFCVLTDNNIEQSKARSGGVHGNKGDEAAITALKMANF